MLHRIACGAIEQGLAGEPPVLDLEPLPATLQAPGACFVTLEKLGDLRGCIGSLHPHRPLAEDALHNACAAAFEDPRFEPLTAGEWPDTSVTISVLGPLVPLAVESEQDLAEQLRPHRDGVVLREDRHTGTFLPAVWEKLPDPGDFVRHLKVKAGLPATHWSPRIEVFRYEVQKIPS